jgi:hypothetical protein
MSIPKLCRATAGVLVACIVFTASIPGCDSNPNLTEYNEHTPPGAPPDVPNESVSQRRARTLRVAKPSRGKGAGTSPAAADKGAANQPKSQ